MRLKSFAGSLTIEHEAARGGLEACTRTGGARAPRGRRTDMAQQYEAYCVKCKAKREFEGEETTLKNGRKAAKGKCPVCGTTGMRILGK
jgi:tartrate dehydratase alpha subunit/fumarate hydratase class I-like protein